ncbi:MAG: glycosyltransferase, partial [Rickettsiales bacterium]
MQLLDLILLFPVALAGLSFSYVGLCIVALLCFRRRLHAEPDRSFRPSVTVLKPVCGDEPELLENLRTFCVQEYPTYQVIFGVRDADDPAIPSIERLIAEHPETDIALVVDDRIYGRNLKVSNLINMFEKARHDIIVVADSDMRVGRGYLAAVAGTFTDPRVGAATCLYSGAGGANLASRLGAMFINDWFLPSALIPTMFGELKFCFGATMAVRRAALKEIGGFEALA